MVDGNKNNPFEENTQPDIKEGEIKKAANGKNYKDRNKNDNKKIDKIVEKPERKSKGL